MISNVDSRTMHARSTKARIMALSHLRPAVSAFCVAAAASGAAPTAGAHELVRQSQSQLIAPSAAFSVSGYGSSTTRTPTPNLGFSDTAHEEVIALARALKHDPVLIREWVTDNVDLNPIFASQKGALGALLDRDGTPFDQAALAHALLQIAASENSAISISSSLEIGTVTVDGTTFDSWFGITDANAACQMLASGGYPATVNGATNCSSLSGLVGTVQLGDVRVRVVVDGDVEYWHPAVKVHNQPDGMDVANVAGVSGSTIVNTLASGALAGTESGLEYLADVNEGALATYLEARADAIQAQFDGPFAGSSLREAVGGARIERQLERRTAAYLPDGASEPTHVFAAYQTGLSAVPDPYRVRLTIDLHQSVPRICGQVTPCMEPDPFGAPIDLYPDEFYGRRLMFRTGGLGTMSGITPTYNFSLSLTVDDVPIASFSDSRQPYGSYRTFDASLLLDQPFLADAGGYADGVWDKTLIFVEDTVVMLGFGRSRSETMRRWADELGEGGMAPALIENDAAWADSQSEEPFLGQRSDQVRARLAANWLAQFSRMSELQGEVGDSVIQHVHSLGVATPLSFLQRESAEPNGPTSNWVVKDQANVVDISSSIAVTSRASDVAQAAAVHRSIATASAVLEGSIYQQTSDAPFVSSLVERWSWANAASGSHQGTEQTQENTTDLFIGPYKLYRVETTADVTAFDGRVTFDGLINKNASVESDIGNFRSVLRSTVSALVADGFEVVALQEAFAGPGVRCSDTRTYQALLDVTFGPGQDCVRGGYNRGGAIIAVNPNTGVVRHILTSTTGVGSASDINGGGDLAHPDTINEVSAPTSEELLDENPADADRHSVDLASGAFSFATGPLLRVGSGEFPYALSFERTFTSGSHAPRRSSWVHNWRASASASGSGMEAMGASRPDNAVGSLAAFAAMQAVHASPASNDTAELRREVAALFVAKWWSDQLHNNTVLVSVGDRQEQFFRRYDGGFNPPATSNSTLNQTGERVLFKKSDEAFYWDGSAIFYDYETADGQTAHFEYASGNEIAEGDFVNPNGFSLTQIWRPTRWNFANGMWIDFTYDDCSGGGSANFCGDMIDRVVNRLGWGLDFYIPGEDPMAPAFVYEVLPGGGVGRRIDLTEATVELPDNEVIRFLIEELPDSARIPENGRWMKAVYSPHQLDSTGAVSSAEPGVRVDYDALGRVTNVGLLDDAGAFQSTQYLLAFSGRAEVLDPLDSLQSSALAGGAVTYYDDQGRVSASFRRTNASGERPWSENEYDGLGRIVASFSRSTELLSDQHFRATQSVYDVFHNVVSETVTPGMKSDGTTDSSAARIVTREYDEPGWPELLTREIDPRGHVSVICYSVTTPEAECSGLIGSGLAAVGLPRATVGPSGETVKVEYDAYGRPTRVLTLVE